MTGCFLPRPSRLTRLQQELLAGFFSRDVGFFLTGGAALAGFYFGHRPTDDLDLFCLVGEALEEGQRQLEIAASGCGAALTPLQRYPEFRRLQAVRGEERCLVDLVFDRASQVETDKPMQGTVRLDSLREIAANKVAALVGRAEPKDLVDLRELLAAGADLALAVDDARRKEGSADPGTLAWLLSELTLGPGARLPPGISAEELLRFRDELVPRLRSLAFEMVRRS